MLEKSITIKQILLLLALFLSGKLDVQSVLTALSTVLQ